MPDPEIKKGGNLSFRTKDGFVITPSATPFYELTKDDFVLVTEVDEINNTVYSVSPNGRVPASEVHIHHSIYMKFPAVGAIFHGECEAITKNAAELGIPITKEFKPYGTAELAIEVLETFRLNPGSKCVVMRGHGEVFIGRNMKEAGEVALQLLQRAKEKGYF